MNFYAWFFAVLLGTNLTAVLSWTPKEWTLYYKQVNPPKHSVQENGTVVISAPFNRDQPLLGQASDINRKHVLLGSWELCFSLMEWISVRRGSPVVLALTPVNATSVGEAYFPVLTVHLNHNTIEFGETCFTIQVGVPSRSDDVVVFSNASSYVNSVTQPAPSKVHKSAYLLSPVQRYQAYKPSLWFFEPRSSSIHAVSLDSKYIFVPKVKLGALSIIKQILKGIFDTVEQSQL